MPACACTSLCSAAPQYSDRGGREVLEDPSSWRLSALLATDRKEGIKERVQQGPGHPKSLGSARSSASWPYSHCCKLLGFACMSERRSGLQPMTQGSQLLRFILTVLLTMMGSYFWVISKAFPASIPQPCHLWSLPCKFCPLSS